MRRKPKTEPRSAGIERIPTPSCLIWEFSLQTNPPTFLKEAQLCAELSTAKGEKTGMKRCD